MKENNMIRNFLKYVSLNMLGMLAISCYILADTYFIANGVGTNGLTALNLALPIYGLINATGLLIGIGGATRYSILKAQEKVEEANKVFTQAIIFGLVLGIIYSLIGLLGSDLLCKLLGADGDTFILMKYYLKTIMCAAPFFIANNILIAFVRNDESPRLSMMGMVIGSLANIILDYIFIFPLQMGMFGAAFATGLAPVISVGILSTHFIGKGHKLKFIKCRIRLRTILDSCNLGISSFVTELSSGFVLLIFNMIILSLSGNLAVAAYGIIANISFVCLAIFTGIAQGIQPLISKYYGDEDYKKVQQVLKYGLLLALLIGILLYIGIYLFADGLTAVFNKEQDIRLAQITIDGMCIYFVGIIFAGINIVSSAYLCAIEKAKRGFLISITRGLVLIVPFVLGLSFMLGLNGIWLSFVCTEVLTCVIAIKSIKTEI